MLHNMHSLPQAGFSQHTAAASNADCLCRVPHTVTTTCSVQRWWCGAAPQLCALIYPPLRPPPLSINAYPLCCSPHTPSRHPPALQIRCRRVQQANQHAAVGQACWWLGKCAVYQCGTAINLVCGSLHRLVLAPQQIVFVGPPPVPRMYVVIQNRKEIWRSNVKMEQGY